MKQYFDYLLDLYNAVNYIRNNSNNDIYDILESSDMQKKALLQVANYGTINIKNILSIDNINDCIPFIEACKESSIFDSVNKLSIIFGIIGDSLGFSFSDFELITGAIVIKNHCYNYDNLKIGSKIKSIFDDKTPFFSLEDICRATKLDVDVVKKYMSLFSEPIQKINQKNIYKIISTERGYLLIFSEKFYYYSFTYLEQYIIEKKVTEKNYYYSKRGKCFEIFVENLLKEFFGEYKIYRNLNYVFNNKKMEIDLLVDFGDSYLIVEDKSTNHLDKKEIDSEESFNKLTVNAYSDGMISLDCTYDYINSNEIIELGSIKLKKKKVYSLIISLRKNFYASGKIQKICSGLHCNHISPLYHISDFADILFVISSNQTVNLKQAFMDYLDKRCEIINEYSNFTADIDEIDLFGMLTTPDYYDRVKTYMEQFRDDNIDFSFMDTSGGYREVVNEELNNRYLSYLIVNKFSFLV